MIALAGMDPIAWLTSTDPLDNAMMWAVAKRRLQLAAEERQDFAVRIVNALGESFDG